MNTTAPSRISIVTPLYNNAEHLAECLESILAQTHQDWDCVVVDNCSTDGSAEIASSYARKDPRIRLHRNARFLSAIANHNAAVRLISPASKYCKVVFADDWIFPDCLEKMVSVADAHPSVGIVGAYVLEGAAVTCTGLPYSSSVLSGREVCRQHLLNHIYVFGSANSLLYRADLVRARDPFFNETNIHADNEVCLALLSTCDFGFVHQVLTYTRVREGSLNTGSMQMQTSMPDWLQMLLTFGPTYLSQDEMASHLRRHLSHYYRFLGKSLLQRRDKDFWGYHRRKMAEAGVAFSHVQLAMGLAITLGDLALNPKRTVEKLVHRLDQGADTARRLPVRESRETGARSQ